MACRLSSDPATSSQSKVVFPIAQENQVVAFSPSSAARGLSAIGDFIFRAALTTDVLVPSGIEATSAKLGYKTAATLYDESDVFSTDSDEAVREALAANGVEVLVTETFRGGDTDFSEQLSRIRDSNPDIIFISSLSPEKPGILMQGRQLGIPNSVPFVVRTLTTADVSAAGDAAEGAITFVGWASTADTPGNSAFVEELSRQIRGGAEQLHGPLVCRSAYLGGSDCQCHIYRLNCNSRRTGKYQRFRHRFR